MRKAFACVVIAALSAVALAQAPPAGEPFKGRWEFLSITQGQSAPPSGASGFLIVDIRVTAETVSAKVLDVAMSPMVTGRVTEASVDGSDLLVVVLMNEQSMRLKGRRVGDHLEGTLTAGAAATESRWLARLTAKSELDMFVPPVSDSPDAVAWNLARGRPTAAERVAAYRKFLEDFPDSRRKEEAYLQIALSQPPADRPTALKKFLDDFPVSPLRDEAEYEITLSIQDASARRAAQLQFGATHPTSFYSTMIYRNLLETCLRERPLNESTLDAVIDGYIKASPEMSFPTGEYTSNLRASAMNTIADRLMATEVMLDKALLVIQQAVTLAGEKEDPHNRAIYTTTLGQVLFKLRRYDEAGAALLHAIEISGGDGDGETQLFLGKFYEVKQQDESAIAAFLKAYGLGAPLDTKASLERAWTRTHGSLTGLKAEFDKIDARLDAAYLAKPKLFDAGRFTRPATTAPARVVLAELFTGAECAPCVAADLAFDGLTDRFRRDDVAVLIYHLHIPGPDPMTNADAEARAKYYGVFGTPTAIVDGSALPAGAGPESMAESTFESYRAKVETRLATKPLAALTGFTARLDRHSITVTGNASLAADGAPASAVLHVVLVEETVRYAGSNGVRVHHLVVRKLLGSAAGTPIPAGGHAAFSDHVDAAAVSSGLDAYLGKYEKSHAQRAPFSFKDRVDQIDVTKLLVVAFVQDEKTKDILQAVVVPTVK